MPSKKRSIALTIVLVLVVGFISFLIGTGVDKKGEVELVSVERMDLVESVFVSGSVEPADEVDLSFERSGRVVDVRADVGETITKGTLLAALDQRSIRADLFEAQSAVEVARANLDGAAASLSQQQITLEKVQSGNRDEEVRISDLARESAQSNLVEARRQEGIVRAQAFADLESDYRTAISTMADAVDDAKTALLDLTTIQYTYFSGTSSEDIRLRTHKASAISALYGVSGAGNYNQVSVSELSGGLYSTVRAQLLQNPVPDPTSLLRETIAAVQETFNALDAISLTAAISTADIATIDSEKESLNSAITALLSAQSNIQTQIANNNTAIANAELDVVSKENALATSQEEFSLSETGSREEDIAVQETNVASAQATVRSREASVNQALARVSSLAADLAQTQIVAPFDGVIAKAHLSVGEFVSTGSDPAFVLITEGGNEVEAFIPELNVGKVVMGDRVEMDFDSFPGEIFTGTIGALDPSETIDDGLTSYGVTIYFDEQDTRILPGMSADTRIVTNAVNNVLTLPVHVIVKKDGAKGVYQQDAEGERLFVEIETGLQGDNGRVEVLSGLNAGERVIDNP